MEYLNLDPVLHARLRLAVMSILLEQREAGFTVIKEKTGASSGNLSAQLQKLKEAGYIELEKLFRDNYPQTICRITAAGDEALRAYASALQAYVRPAL